VRIEMLYFDGCPNADLLADRVREILTQAGRTDEIHLRTVDSPEAAEHERFLGSPTLRIDGRDVDPGASERRGYALTCRRYATPGGIAGLPAETWIRTALGL
jgi:hypothetical protein